MGVLDRGVRVPTYRPAMLVGNPPGAPPSTTAGDAFTAMSVVVAVAGAVDVYHRERHVRCRSGHDHPAKPAGEAIILDGET